MHKQIYVNLPVSDLQKTRAFFSALGFTFEPRFSNDDAACMVVGENIFVMLLTRPFYKTFTDKKIADTQEFTAVANCLSCESRREVDDLVARAGRGRHVDADVLEHARLVLERDRLSREIKYLREHGGGGGSLPQLSAEYQDVIRTIKTVVTRLERPV